MNPCGDRRRRRADPADRARAARCASQDIRIGGRPDRRRRRDPARRPRHRRRAARQPARRQRDPNARRIVAHGLRNPFRLTLRPGTGEVWVGDVGWNDWEEIDRIAAPTARRRQLRLALLRGRRPDAGLRQPEPEPLRDALRAGRRRRRDAATTRTGTPTRSSRARRARRAAPRSPACSSTPAAASPRAYRGGAVLRGLHAQLHLGHAEGRRRAARPGAAPDVRLRRDAAP